MQPHPFAPALPPVSSTLLIVDDNPISRLFIEKILRAQGYTQIVLATNGFDALEAMHLHHPALVVLDIVMPQMDGFACCAAIRADEQFRDTPILIQTAITEPALRVKAFVHGATDFISKPVYPEELLARVKVHLDKQQALRTLQEYRQRTSGELEQARQLQQSMLPAASELEKISQTYGLDLASILQSSSELGGDFWGIRPLDATRVALWIVDMSGHGVASALNAMRLQELLREPVPPNMTAGGYLSYINEHWLRLTTRGQFATMFFAVIDTAAQTLSYASACTPNPIVRRGALLIAEQLDGAGMPLGIRAQHYPTRTIPFLPGDALLLYSDALIETPSTRGDFMTELDLAATLTATEQPEANSLLGAVWGRLEAHRARAADDDLTLIVCRRKAE